MTVFHRRVGIFTSMDPYSLLYLFAMSAIAASTLSVAFFAWHRRHVPGATALVVLMIGAAGYAIPYMLELASVDRASAIFWYNVSVLGASLVGPAWLMFTAQFMSQKRTFTWRAWFALLVVPGIVCALVWTNPWHGWYGTVTHFDPVGELPRLEWQWGMGYWINFWYAYGMTFLGIVRLLWATWRNQALYRNQAVMLLFGAAIPILFNVAFALGYTPIPKLDLAPFAFPLTGLAWGIAVWRLGLLEVLPIAREAVMTHMPSGAIVLDGNERVLEVNLAARRMLGLTAEVVGCPARECLPAEIALTVPNRSVAFVSTEITLGAGDAQQFLLAQVTTLYDARQAANGRLILLHDMTQHARAEAALKESETRYRQMFERNRAIKLLIDPVTGAIVEANPAAADFYGYAVAQLEQMRITEINQLPAPQVQAAMQQACGGKLEHFIFPHRIASGEIRMVEVYSSPVAIRGKDYLYSIILDVTERMQHDREMQAVAEISAALRAAATREQMLPIILDQIARMFTLSGASIVMIDPATGDQVTEAAYGESAASVGERLPAATGISGDVITSGKFFITADLQFAPRFARPDLLCHPTAAVCVPLMAQTRTIGVLWVGREKNFQPDHVRLLNAVANIAANAIYRSTLHEQTLRAAQELEQAYDTTLEGWSSALELRDQETEGHTQRVVVMTLALARACGIPEPDLVHVRRGALLHDIGKMGVPDRILRKPGALTPDEWAIMRQHPHYAYAWLSRIEFLRPALDIPYCHHEKWDGTGYPRGLRGAAIPLAARIFALVDVWDALCSDRAYRKAWTRAQARDYIRAQAGVQFDPTVVPLFLQIENETQSGNLTAGLSRKEIQNEQSI